MLQGRTAPIQGGAPTTGLEIAQFDGRALVLVRATGALLGTDDRMLGALRGLAAGARLDAAEALLLRDLPAPRYVAREQVRTMSAQLRSASAVRGLESAIIRGRLQFLSGSAHSNVREGAVGHGTALSALRVGDTRLLLSGSLRERTRIATALGAAEHATEHELDLVQAARFVAPLDATASSTMLRLEIWVIEDQPAPTGGLSQSTLSAFDAAVAILQRLAPTALQDAESLPLLASLTSHAECLRMAFPQSERALMAALRSRRPAIAQSDVA